MCKRSKLSNIVGLSFLFQIPPRDNIDRVPLGASSASMYPGYSPADHIYGEAAAEYGMIMAEARRKGIEVKTDSEGLEYIVGQSSLSAREQIEQIKKEREQKKATDSSANPATEDGVEDLKGEPMEDVQETGDGADLFTIDPNPTPVDQLQDISTAIRAKNKANDKAKRRVSFQDEQSTTDDVPKKKMVKTSENVAVPNTATSAGINDDFEEAVEARLKQKEEKRKKKTTDGKKRKRESDSSQIVREEPGSIPEQAAVPINEVLTQKPKKKKAKKVEDEADAPVFESNASEDQTEKKRKKKRPSTESGDADHTGEADTKRKKKKHKKETAD